MSTRTIALAMVSLGLMVGIGAAYYRALSCGTGSHCDEHWNAAALTASGAVGMGWAWLTQSPVDRLKGSRRNPEPDED